MHDECHNLVKRFITITESAWALGMSCRVENGDASEPVVKWQLYFYTLAASASELANGYDIGAFSFALLYLKV